MKQVEKFIRTLDLPHINIQYLGSIQVFDERIQAVCNGKQRYLMTTSTQKNYGTKKE